MLKYAIHPDFVRSKRDGDVHYIAADHLIHLYGVDPRVCLVIDDSLDRHTYALRMQKAEELNLIHLYPRYDGNYTLPKEKA